MKKACSLISLLLVVLLVVSSCGGGGGGEETPAATNTTITSDTTGTNTTGTTTSVTPAGGCAGFNNITFKGTCQDYYGIAASTYESDCKSDPASVWYAGGCPATIGSSTRLGTCKQATGTTEQYFVFVFYSPENTLERAKTVCGSIGGTWTN